MLVFKCDECGKEIIDELGYFFVKKVVGGRRVIILCEECKKGGLYG